MDFCNCVPFKKPSHLPIDNTDNFIVVDNDIRLSQIVVHKTETAGIGLFKEKLRFNLLDAAVFNGIRVWENIGRLSDGRGCSMHLGQQTPGLHFE